MSIDDFCAWRGVDRVNYIKMDIEGWESEALSGADRTIRDNHPKLAISVYHKFSDLWTISSELKRRYPFYSFFLDHHSLHNEETVLYAKESSGLSAGTGSAGSTRVPPSE